MFLEKAQFAVEVSDESIITMADKKFNSFGMEKMKQKDEEARLERMNTKQRRGTPTVSFKCFSFKKIHIIFCREMLDFKQKYLTG